MDESVFVFENADNLLICNTLSKILLSNMNGLRAALNRFLGSND